MIFSPLDALIFRRRSRAAQRRVEIFAGFVIILVGTPCGYFAATSWPARLGGEAFCLVGGILMVARAWRDARRATCEAAKGENIEADG